MVTLADTLHTASEALHLVTDTPRLDAEILLAHALRISRAQLLARLNESYPEDTSFDALLQRRAHSEPIAYILGEWEFYSLPFYVEPPVLVPRPETEHLVEAALRHLGGRRGEVATILDMGTGTGCVAVSCLKHLPDAVCTATDIRPANLDLALRNARRNSVDTRLSLLAADAFTALVQDGRFDAILSNPPYIGLTEETELPPAVRDYEDPVALFAGSDGMELIDILIQESLHRLRPGGLLAFEIGVGQHHNAAARMNEGGYIDVTWTNDLAGIPRIITGQAPHG
jgi:release factor glutamine methyltransferase